MLATPSARAVAAFIVKVFWSSAGDSAIGSALTFFTAARSVLPPRYSRSVPEYAG